MSRTLGALIVVTTVAVIGASITDARQAPQQPRPAPAPAAPAIPAGLPDWAYTPPNPPGTPPAPSALPTDDAAVVRVPGTARTLTRGQLRGQVEIPDWFPEEHGPMPTVVRYGREGVRACGFCHLSTGVGRPENASVNGLHPEYFIQQMNDYKRGLRDSSDPRKNNTNLMIDYAKNATQEEILAAAHYFAQQPYSKRINVIESATAPKVRLQGGMHMVIPEAEGGGMEPLGNQIVEVPDDALRAEARDTHMGYTAYVPAGSIAKGKAVAGAYQCTICHGASLQGLGPAPPLAGRSPSYTMRQLFDMKTMTRRGPWAEMMKPIVDKMSLDDMMAVSAFAGSLTPAATGAVRSTR